MDGEAQPSRGCASHFRPLRMSKSPKEFLEKRLPAVGQSATSAGHASMSERSPEADIEVAAQMSPKNTGASKSTFPAME